MPKIILGLKNKILTFFAFTDVIYLQVQQIGFRSITNNPIWSILHIQHKQSIICIFELNFKTMVHAVSDYKKRFYKKQRWIFGKI